ncbi:hypothetical protein LCGC14_1972980, partial [marine sediment metagenome]
LEDNALFWIVSFKRSELYTDAKGEKLLKAILRDLAAKKTFILRYYDKRDSRELQEQIRAVREKSNLLSHFISTKFEKEISGRALEWIETFYQLNECFVDFIEKLFDNIFILTKDIPLSAYLKGQSCMKFAFETGKNLDKFIVFKPGLLGQ